MIMHEYKISSRFVIFVQLCWTLLSFEPKVVFAMEMIPYRGQVLC